MKLSEYLQHKLDKRGEQARLARKLEISTATASKWASGDLDVVPRFESCVKIAIHYGISPLEVFEMAERPDYTKLFLELTPGFNGAPAPAAGQIGYCKEHEAYIEMLETILHGPEEEWKIGIISNLKAMSRAAISGTPPEGEHGPHSPEAHFLPGDRFRVDNKICKRRRN